MKKFATIACALILCFLVAITFVACGGNNETWDKVSSDASLREAVSGKSARIRLTDDISLSSTIEIDKTCTIDLNGHKIIFDTKDMDKSMKNSHAIHITGKENAVTIQNGSIEKLNSDNSLKSAVAVLGSSAILDNVDIISDGFGIASTTGAMTTVRNNSSIKSHWIAIGTNNSQTFAGGSIMIDNSNIESTDDVALFVSSYISMNVNNSIVKGTGAMHIGLGNINVTNSTLEATAQSHNPYTAQNINASGTKEDEGSTIAIRANRYYDNASNTNDLTFSLANNIYVAQSGVKVAIYDANYPSRDFDGKDEDTIVDSYLYATEYFKNSNLAIKAYKLEDGQMNEYELLDGKYVHFTGASTESELTSAIANNDYIRLNSDITIANKLQIEKSCYIDMNGHKLIQNGANNTDISKSAVVRVYAKEAENELQVYIKNGEIVKENCGSVVAPALTCAYNNNTTLENVKITSDSQGVVPAWGAKLNLKDCQITTKWQAIGTNNTNPGENNTINAKNCEIVSTNDVSVFVSNYTMVNIDSSTIKGLTGMHILLGDINVMDSNIIATSTYNPYNSSDIKNSGTKEREGSAIVVRANLYYDNAYNSNAIVLNFTNNTITTESGVDVSIYDCKNARNLIPESGTEGATIIDTNTIAVDYFKARDLVVKEYVLNDGVLTLVENEAI